MARMTIVILLYIGWIIAHYISAHLYTKICVPNTLMGMAMSPFMAASSQCIGLRWVINTGGNNICSMWTLLGMWVAEKVLIDR
jgi:hypothetical protein